MLLLRWQAKIIHIGEEPALGWESGAVSPVRCMNDDWEVDALSASAHQILHDAPWGPRRNLVLGHPLVPWTRPPDSYNFFARAFDSLMRKREDFPKQPKQPKQPKPAKNYHPAINLQLRLRQLLHP